MLFLTRSCSSDYSLITLLGLVIQWLKNFFCGRSEQTKVGLSLSDVSELLSGVKQGSSIGPLMFLISINELVYVLEKLGIKVKLFADDAKLYLHVMDENGIIKLQAGLDSLSNWAATWQLTVSVEKCFVLNIGNVIIQPRISINDILLLLFCPVVTSE